MILLDTCALLWWVFDDKRFSRKARPYIRKMETSFGYISSISIWEIGIKINKKKIEIPISIEEFTARIKKSGVVKIIPIDEALWIKSLQLKWKNLDPADRIIVSTGIHLDAPIITSDKAIRAYHNKVIW